MDKKLVKNTESINGELPILFCLPFAGGGASAYGSWMKKLDGICCVCPIQLPGREERMTEPPYEEMGALLSELEETVSYFINLIRGAYAVWGHSMGGKLGYELERRLEARGYTAEGFFVSGSRVPHIPEPEPVYHLPDCEFKEKLARFEGTPKELLEHPELLDFFLPMLRADFKMDETYCSDNPVPLKCPIVAFSGAADREASAKEMQAWREYTVNDFVSRVFEGGHFFIREQEDEIIRTIAERMTAYRSDT
ncbi:MAG: thioesterase [Lachnospiraceae bacterium]|nr:thioesterase [Lachnospiraceae bacterium]